MSLILLTEENFEQIIQLFDSNFYFFTKYPQLLSSEELKLFLDTGQAYILSNNNKAIGLAYYAKFNSEYVLFRFKLKTYENEKNDISLLNEFLKIIKINVPDIKRLETTIFEFDKDDINFHNKAGFKCEIRDRCGLYKDGKYHDMFIYTLIGDEINI